MNKQSRTITGISAIVIGTLVIIFAPLISIKVMYGVFPIIIGFFIFNNKKEDDIEQIKKK